jgi:hypothetical protein
MEVDVSRHSRMSHKFHIGQLVEFHPKKGAPISAARGAYEIVKQLPERDGELQYGIKSAVEEHERIALKSELVRFSWFGREKDRGLPSDQASKVPIGGWLKRPSGLR